MFLQMTQNIPHTVIMSVELNLARAIDEQIFFLDMFQLVYKPWNVSLQEFHAINQAAIRPQIEMSHDFFQFDELWDVNVGFVGSFFIGWIDVDNRHISALKMKIKLLGLILM